MFKFKDTNLEFNKRLRNSLCNIHGIGFQRSSFICDSLGLGSSLNINFLNNYIYELISGIFKNFYILDERLKSLILQRLNFFVENRLIVGLRLKKALPVRGQRTQTNSKTAKKIQRLPKVEEIINPIIIKKNPNKLKKKINEVKKKK